ncbi:MAG: hypothetical protein RI564_04845 [Gracilimonas sp.]|nr:hypothetical protein [Gracilimonas sp.]
MQNYSKLYLNSIILSFLLTLGVGCKNTPTFIPDNELDPGSKYYSLAKPFNINVELLNNEYTDVRDELRIHWKYPRSERYIDKFKIFRSDTDTSSFKEIGELHKKSRSGTSGSNYTYNFFDQEKYNGLHIWYKIQAVFEQEDGMLISESEPFSFSTSEFQISASIQPFVKNPNITLDWQYSELDENVNIEIYSSSQSDDTFELEHTADISSNSTSFSLNINQSDETKYFYKLVLDEIQSGHERIPATVNRPAFGILNSSVYSENEAELHIGIMKDSSGFNQGDFYIDNYELEVFYASKIDTSQFYPLQKISGTFTSPYTEEIIDNLQKDNIYIFHLTGSRGNYKTALTRQLLTHKFHIAHTSAFNAETNGIIFANGSFNSSNSHFIISSNGKSPLIIDVQNTKVETHSKPTQLQGMTSTFADYKNTKDAIITSSYTGNVSVWNPDTKELLYKIPNFGEEIENSADFHPVDFAHISEEELLIAYGDVDPKRGSVNNYNVAIWNSSTESHELIYQVNEESMYSYGFKVAYFDNTILLFYSYELDKVKLVALNKDDLSIQNQSFFTQKIDAWSEYQNLYFSNSGKEVLLYTEYEAIQIQLDDHEIISSIRDVRYSFGWSDIRGFSTAKNISLICYGGDYYWYSRDPFYSQIRCTSNYLHEANIIDLRVEGYLNGLLLSKNGSKLAAIFHNKIIVYTLENGWVLTTNYEM